MESLERFRPLVALLGRIALYFAAAYTSLALVSFSFAWRAFEHSSTNVLATGGRVASGHVASVRSSGFWPYLDYFIRVDSNPEEFMIPWALVSSPWEFPPQPAADIDPALVRGAIVHIASSGGPVPVILNLEMEVPGQANRKLMDYGRSAGRYSLAMNHAPQVADRFLVLSIVPFLIALAIDPAVRRRVTARVARWRVREA